MSITTHFNESLQKLHKEVVALHTLGRRYPCTTMHCLKHEALTVTEQKKLTGLFLKLEGIRIIEKMMATKEGRIEAGELVSEFANYLIGPTSTNSTWLIADD